jgi:hypothetical protein
MEFCLRRNFVVVLLPGKDQEGKGMEREAVIGMGLLPMRSTKIPAVDPSEKIRHGKALVGNGRGLSGCPNVD